MMYTEFHAIPLRGSKVTCTGQTNRGDTQPTDTITFFIIRIETSQNDDAVSYNFESLLNRTLRFWLREICAKHNSFFKDLLFDMFDLLFAHIWSIH